jgi:hypothetical protein
LTRERKRNILARMVAWNGKVRGIMLAEGHHPLGYSVWCEACGRGARVRYAVAIAIWGPRAYMRDVARSLRCTRCGAARAVVQTISDPRPRHSLDTSYWGPSPDWPEIEAPAGRAGRDGAG